MWQTVYGPRLIGIVLALLLSVRGIDADENSSRKVALLIGVNHYLKPGFPDLQFAEADVAAVAAELESLDFEVTLLLGSETGDAQATLENIEQCARELVAPLGKQDVALVMLSGHGQTLRRTAESAALDEAFYCPVDAVLNDPAAQFSLSYLLDDILGPNVGRRIVVVDACRDVPLNAVAARSSKGIEGRYIRVPEDTAIFFSCRAGQISYEHNDLGHGLFTYCLLEALRQANVDSEIAWQDVVAYVSRRMDQPELTRFMPAEARQVPIAAGAMPYTVLGIARTSADAGPTENPEPVAVQPVAAAELVGRRPGEVRSFTDGDLPFVWCPPGQFVMGNDPDAQFSEETDRKVRVRITQGFWAGQTEVTQRLWQSVMGTTPWVEFGENFDFDPQFDYPATYIMQGAGSDRRILEGSAIDFCRRMTRRERDAGRIPGDWSYRLPTEAEWEYACRAGTTTTFHFGDDPGQLGDYAWYDGDNPGGIAPVAQKHPNQWGLYDMHGNVMEWCLDDYSLPLPGGVDPLVLNGGDLHVFRGGGWGNNPGGCRSAFRIGERADFINDDIGFRLVLGAIRK